MRPATRYSLVEVHHDTNRAVLARDGRAGATAVDGVVLEAQFELGDGRGLVCLTDDSPYDEGLHVYLLGHDGSVEDGLEAGAAFRPGIFKLRDSGECWLEFEFFSNRSVYRIEVARRAGIRLWLPAGWTYKRHRLVVRQAAAPAAAEAARSASALPGRTDHGSQRPSCGLP